MSSGLYSHTTRGAGTVLTAAIYNADHVNHITNFNPQSMGSYSDSVGQMQTKSDPGGLGSEVLAGNMAEELQHLRFAINRIQGTTHWYEAPVTSLATIGGGVPLNLAFGTTPLTLRRTENNTSELEFLSTQAGSGAGDKYSQRLVGTGSNAIAEIRQYIGSVELLRWTKTLITNQIAQHMNALFTSGAAGAKVIGLDPSGFMDFKEVLTPANPAADFLRMYVRDESGNLRFVIRDQSGGEIVIGAPPPPTIDEIQLGTETGGSSGHSTGSTKTALTSGNVISATRIVVQTDPSVSVSFHYWQRPVQAKLTGGSFVTISQV